MPIFRKSKVKQSSRHQIAIKGVHDGILELPRHEYRLILHISSINFELKSEAEQDAIIETYQSFLNSLSTSLQIIIRIRELDMDKYLLEFNDKAQKESEEIYKTQISNYTSFVSSLITTNKILTRQFYVVVPFTSHDNDKAVVKEQLTLQAELVAKGLARLGMQAKKLNSLEVLDLFYSFYNPSAAKYQPLTAQTLRAVTEQYL